MPKSDQRSASSKTPSGCRCQSVMRSPDGSNCQGVKEGPVNGGVNRGKNVEALPRAKWVAELNATWCDQHELLTKLWGLEAINSRQLVKTVPKVFIQLSFTSFIEKAIKARCKCNCRLHQHSQDKYVWLLEHQSCVSHSTGEDCCRLLQTALWNKPFQCYFCWESERRRRLYEAILKTLQQIWPRSPQIAKFVTKGAANAGPLRNVRFRLQA